MRIFRRRERAFLLRQSRTTTKTSQDNILTDHDHKKDSDIVQGLIDVIGFTSISTMDRTITTVHPRIIYLSFLFCFVIFDLRSNVEEQILVEGYISIECLKKQTGFETKYCTHYFTNKQSTLGTQ